MWHTSDTREMHTGFWQGYLREGDYLEVAGVGGRMIILKQIFKKWDGSDSGQGQVAGCFGHGYEPQGSIRRGECLDQLRNCQLVRKDCAAWSQLVNWLVSRDDVVGTVIRYGLGCLRFELGGGRGGGEIFLTHQDQPWGANSLPYNGYWVYSGQEREVDQHIVVPKLRMSGAVPPLPPTLPSLCVTG